MANKRNLKRDLEANASSAAQSAQSLVIEQPTILSIGVEVSGTADLIQNKFSQKSVEQMLKSHMGISVQRERKKPREVLEEATIRNTDGKVAMPPTGFKLAMISAATQIKGLKKTQLRTALFVQGILSQSPTKRQRRGWTSRARLVSDERQMFGSGLRFKTGKRG